ncbi:hypothetical protein DH2020_000647 [Rehmannia glutinosa]|uniref:Leucine-rich repeat-containing N-terminal plant-type domain-containing protein n=1 Tax=Rehmannia glutinosa TaxID=99300 RepID=A0ABR0XXJ2_REHGL
MCNCEALHEFQFPLLQVSSCNQADRDSLDSFYQHISSPQPPPSPLNWSSTDCCRWEGIACTYHHHLDGRVTHISLPGRALSGTISPFLANLSFLSYLNLSGNHLSGPLPLRLFHDLNHLQTLDLSGNHFSGLLQPPQSSDSLPTSITTVDLSSNHFNGSIDPWGSPLLNVLDFSVNEFSGHIFHGIGECSKLHVFRAGFNSLSGWLPYDLYGVKTLKLISLPNNHFSGPINNTILLLSNLTILELHVNELTGEIPPEIGLLSNLEQLQLHTNNLNGTLPPSLTDCTSLTTLLLRNNHFEGQISTLDFSKLQRLQAIDLGNNSFTGNIPASLCLCRSLTAVRLAYNQLVGEIPPCMASLTSLEHLSLSDNYLSNVVGALKILRHCDNLAVVFMSRCFHDEMMPDDYDLLHLNGFQNLQILTLGGCKLKGQIPSWIAKLRKLKVLNLSYNKISGPIPTWLGAMPSLFVLNLTQNFLSGELPREIARLPALIADNTSTDLSSLALPFLFDSLQYNRLFNLPRGLKVGNNSLSDMSGNHLSGEIPVSLTQLHFLSSFSVANNDLQGEIPTGGQFETFPAASFEGNPQLCGNVLRRSCSSMTPVDVAPEEEDDHESSWYKLPFGMGYFVGFFAVSITWLFHSSWRRSSGVDSNVSETRSM